MTRFGYTLMTEQSGPRELLAYAGDAERLGFDFLVSSDHYSPWLESQGHSPYAWTLLGAVAATTETIGLMTYVTCPTTRYHPAVVAQKAATLQILAEGRFTLGLGSGERLNEHAVGLPWPGVDVRQDRLVEAIEIIRALHAGETVTHRGQHFHVDEAKVWDLPDQPVTIAAAVSGKAGIRRFAPLSDHLVAVEPEAELLTEWRDAGGAGRSIGQIPISWDPDSREAGRARAHDQFRWFGGGWKVNADLPTPAAFAAATSFVRPEDVAESIACGPDLDAIVEAVSPWWEAGFTDVALVQIGDEMQQRFLDEAAGPLLEKLRAAAPPG
jgi:G6PDH family F420-dependent oxidoreductase